MRDCKVEFTVAVGVQLKDGKVESAYAELLDDVDLYDGDTELWPASQYPDEIALAREFVGSQLEDLAERMDYDARVGEEEE